jgi:hypothetical protein
VAFGISSEAKVRFWAARFVMSSTSRVLPFVLHKIIARLKEADSYKRAIDFPEFIQFSFFSALKNKVIKSSSSLKVKS